MRISWDFPWLCWIAGGLGCIPGAPWIHRCSSIRSPSFIVKWTLQYNTKCWPIHVEVHVLYKSFIPILCLYQNLDSNLTIIHIYIYIHVYIYINNYIMLYIYYITIIIMIYHIKRNSWLFSQRPRIFPTLAPHGVGPCAPVDSQERPGMRGYTP